MNILTLHCIVRLILIYFYYLSKNCFDIQNVRYNFFKIILTLYELLMRILLN